MNRLPNSRVSGYDRSPARLMGPGPDVRKPGPTPPEDVFQVGPFNGLNVSGFQEVYRRTLAGFAHGRIIANADVAVSAATAGSLVAPFLWVDIQIVGYTNGVPEVLAYGASGLTMVGRDTAFGMNDNTNMDAPPLQAEWDDSFGFDEVAINIRTMGNGGQPFGAVAGWASNPGDIINVNVSGKLWR